MDIENHYNTLWNEFLERFKSNQFELDPLIDSKDDTRYGMTLLARPSNEIKQQISLTLDEIKEVAPRQYYYPESDLHVTVLSIISCYPEFSINQIDPEEYQEIVQSVVGSTAPFEIEFRGVTASPSCILIQGFPKGNQLTVLRDELRKAFKESGLQHSIDKRYTLQTSHMTVVRFREPFKHPGKFINKITRLRDRHFGSCMIDQVELVGNDWYQKKEKVKSLATFPLIK